MDLVYICKDGNNEELRYSIRSAIKNFPHKNVWVIGGRPSWYSGNFFRVANDAGKFQNINKCISLIPSIGEISEDFVLMNDDFFLLSYIDEMPVYHGGLLQDKVNSYFELGSRNYSKLLLKTLNDLKRQGISNPIDYDIHVPMVMNKEKLEQSINKAYFPRSAYGNINQIGGELILDVKTYGQKSPLASRSYNFLTGDAEMVSTDDNSFINLYEKVLKNRFLEPSKYETM
jgi:hypothetical protein